MRSKRTKHLDRTIDVAAHICNSSVALDRSYYQLFGKPLKQAQLQKHLVQTSQNQIPASATGRFPIPASGHGSTLPRLGCLVQARDPTASQVSIASQVRQPHAEANRMEARGAGETSHPGPRLSAPSVPRNLRDQPDVDHQPECRRPPPRIVFLYGSSPTRSSRPDWPSHRRGLRIEDFPGAFHRGGNRLSTTSISERTSTGSWPLVWSRSLMIWRSRISTLLRAYSGCCARRAHGSMQT